MRSSSLSFRASIRPFVLSLGYSKRDSLSLIRCTRFITAYFDSKSIVFLPGNRGEDLEAYIWDREDGWLPVSLLTRSRRKLNTSFRTGLVDPSLIKWERINYSFYSYGGTICQD